MSHHSHLPPKTDEAIRSVIRRHKRGLRLGCLAAVLLALVIAAVAVWALYQGALRIKDVVKDSIDGKIPAIRLPLEWEKPLGDSAMAQLRGQYPFVTNRRVLEPLEILAAPLMALSKNASERYSIFVTDSKEVNAFALPGGTIVFHRGLLERANSAEEIQGVLAHEMAHVQKRHGVIQLVQNIGMNITIQQLQGGDSRLLDALIRDSGQLFSLKFSRDHERAADDLGWELLEKAQVNPRGMLSFFAGLQAAGTTQPNALLSTHPAPRDRLDRLAKKAASLPPRPYPSFEQPFSALQSALGRTPAKP